MEDFLTGPGMLALLMGLGIAAFFLLFVLYVYSSAALMTIAKKTKTEPAWLAWVPIINIYLMVKIAGLEWYWALGIFAGIVPFIGAVLVLVWAVYIWWIISEKRSYPGWVGILMAIPGVNLIALGVLAWRDNK